MLINLIHKRHWHTKFPMKAGFLTAVSVISAKVTWARHLALAFINIYRAGRVIDPVFRSRLKTCSVSIWGRCKSPTILKISRQSNIGAVLRVLPWSHYRRAEKYFIFTTWIFDSPKAEGWLPIPLPSTCVKANIEQKHQLLSSLFYNNRIVYKVLTSLLIRKANEETWIGH